MFRCSQYQTSVLEVNDEHSSGCKEDTKLERNRSDESGGNFRTWRNAKRDPFILKFPPEIASHIFCLSSYMARDSDASLLLYHEQLKKLPTPFLLGSVCRGWRLLAQSTPELWTMLSFTLAKPTKPAGLSQIQAVSDWLQLSGALPLKLYVLQFIGADPLLLQDACDPVINILNQHSGRWHTLLLSLPAPFFSRFHGTSPPSILCDLTIQSHYHRHYSDNISPTFKMHSRPNPTHLTIWCMFSHISAFDIAWDNLVSLKLALSKFDGCIEVVLKAPHLEFCSIDLLRI